MMQMIYVTTGAEFLCSVPVLLKNIFMLTYK